MELACGVLIALLLLIAPGAVVARVAQLTWPVAVAVGPPLTYGVVGIAILPYGALGIPWNAGTALAALALVTVLAAGLRALLSRRVEPPGEARVVNRRQLAAVAAGVLLGALLIGYAALLGIPHWQSIPSTWDAVWHANTVRFILDTGQASPTHMGELRNVETHALLYYPSTFHALAAVLCQLTGAAPTTGYTLSSLAAAVWLFPAGAAVLTWLMLPPGAAPGRRAGAAGTAAALSASFTAVPYVEFGVAAMPNLTAYGLAVPTMALITSTLRHRDRIPVAVLALLGVFSVHLTGGFVVVLLLLAWWLLDALHHPVRSRLADALTLAAVAAPTALVLTPQFLGVLNQADIIAGHSFPAHEGSRHALIAAVLQHTRHLNDFPIQYALLALAAIGATILLVKRIWWPLAVWLLLIASIVYSAAPFAGPVGDSIETFSQFFYNDPRRLSAVVTMLLAPMAGIGLYAITRVLVAGTRRLADRFKPLPAPVWVGVTAALVAVASVVSARHYFWRHLVLFGDKYDSVMIDRKDLQAMAYLAALPGAKDTLIGNANTDGTAWMYAVAGLHPLWTHYDYPVQQGPGYHRFIFWAYADDADTDPRVAEAVRALDICYVLTSAPTVRGFVIPDGLVSLEASKSWTKIYDNGEARIYRWRGCPAAAEAQNNR